jgi:hypothetical protein
MKGKDTTAARRQHLSNVKFKELLKAFLNLLLIR